MMWHPNFLHLRTHRRALRRRRQRRPWMVERLEERTLLSTIQVTSTSDRTFAADNVLTLRDAIRLVNGDLTVDQLSASQQALVTGTPDQTGVTDTIDFNITGPGVHTIQPLIGLPYITHPVTIDGYSQPGASPNTLAVGDNAVLNIELDGSLAGSNNVYGLVFAAAGNTVRGLVVNRFSYPSLFFGTGSDSNRIQGNFIGTDPTGEQGLLGGISIYDSNRNLIGTDGDGVNDYAERNIVMSGIGLNGSDNVVAGNYIGTDASGTVALGNTWYGVSTEAYFPVTGNRIGVDGHDPDAPAERNIISGNQSGGISISGIHSPCTDNIVAGNYIGTDATGEHALGNGLYLYQNAVNIAWSDCNRIGTDGDGVGDAEERNVISGNAGNGVAILGSNNVVAGNYIGTDATGTHTTDPGPDGEYNTNDDVPLGNGNNGVSLNYGGTGNIIGINPQHVGMPQWPDWAGEGNIIAANAVGITIGETQGGHLIAGNWIGLLADGTPVTNSGGIWVRDDSNDQIGGSPALANRIVDGPGVGVWVIDGTTSGISVRANSIVSDGLHGGAYNSGIYLNGYAYHAGPLAGPNNMQNYPVLATAAAGSATHVMGTLGSTPNTAFLIDFYANDPDEVFAGSYTQGHYYLGSATVRTDASGNASFNISKLGASMVGQWISATATDPSGDTSEFSLDVQAIKAASTTTLTASDASPLLGQSVTFTAAVSGNSGTPTGYVDFVDTTTNTDLGTVRLTNGVAALPTSALAPGDHTIVANYGGDAAYVASSASTTTNVLPPASLSGVVFSDFNDDGQVDFGERGIPGVPITLTGTDDLGNAVNLCQLTDADGTYVFLDLRPGSYTIAETQPAGYTQGINTAGTAGGTVVGDQFTGIGLKAGVNGLNYNYGERPAAGSAVSQGQTATIGFWNNKNGQALIRALSGGPTSTQLGNWLAATFPHMFGASAGSSDLAGKTNDFIASFFQDRFVVHGQKLDAQVLATALAVYVTDPTLDNTGIGTQYGFTVSGNGVATATYNVASNGAAFGVADNTTMTVMDLLLAADAQALDGVLYNGDTAKRNMANSVFSSINQAGGI